MICSLSFLCWRKEMRRANRPTTFIHRRLDWNCLLVGYRRRKPQATSQKRRQAQPLHPLFALLLNWWKKWKRKEQMKPAERISLWVSGTKWNVSELINGIDFVESMKLINERQWNGVSERRTKGPNAPRQAKNNSKSMLARFCRIDWIVCGGRAGVLFFLFVGYGRSAP